LLDESEILTELVYLLSKEGRVSLQNKGEGQVLEDVLSLLFTKSKHGLEELIFGGDGAMIADVIH
jgi:hypothetical protein